MRFSTININCKKLFQTGIIASIFLFASSVAFGKWYSISNEDSPKPIDVSIIKTDLESTVLKITVYGIESEKISIDDQEFSTVSIPGLSTTDQKGFPEVPRYSKNILIPAQSNPAINIIRYKTESLDLGAIVPSKGAIMRNIDPAKVAYTFSSFYSSDEAYPSTFAKISSPFILRSAHGITLEVFPVQYDRMLNQTNVLSEMIVEIKTPIENGKSKTFFGEPKSVDEGFMSIYENHFLNFSNILNSKDINPAHFIKDQGKVLIISHESFVDALTPFISWKRQKGLIVKLATLAETGSTYQTIKAYIQKEYDANGLSYVILVGDAEFVPYYVGTSGNVSKNEADPMYGLVAGNDSYPDLFVSRLSVKTTADVENIINRSINYERNPDLNGSWYAKSTGIASAEGDPTDFARAEILRDMLEKYHYTTVDKFYDPDNASANQLTAALNEGRSFINYIGHGSKTSWGTTGFSNSDIDNLQNGSKLPFIVSVACVNGDFGAGSDAFAERWLKAGSASAPKGALAVYASSTNQSWVPPTVGQKEIVNLIVKEQANTIGGLFFNGVVAVLEDNSSTAVQTFQSWHAFGDATIQVRTTKPVNIKVQMPEYLTNGSSDIKLTVKEKNISAGIVQNNKLIGRGFSDGSGEFKIKLNEPLTTGDALITLTGFDKIPVIQSVPVR